VYKCFINNQLEGTSDDLKDLIEILEDYVRDCQDNGKVQQEFRVIKEGYLKIVNSYKLVW
jgi:hypothetical protein